MAPFVLFRMERAVLEDDPRWLDERVSQWPAPGSSAHRADRSAKHHRTRPRHHCCLPKSLFAAAVAGLSDSLLILVGAIGVGALLTELPGLRAA